MIPEFRYALLSVDDRKEPTNLKFLMNDPEIDRTKKGVEVDDNVIH